MIKIRTEALKKQATMKLAAIRLKMKMKINKWKAKSQMEKSEWKEDGFSKLMSFLNSS